MVSVEGVVKRFGTVEALRKVSFRGERQQILGFLGPNGAGKTTTMRIITGFLPPDEGRVVVNGFCIPGQAMEVKRQIGYVPENVGLYRDMTVWSLLEYFALLRGVPPRSRTAAVERVVDRCGLGEVRGRRTEELSRGFRQRLCLAQALVHGPSVLVLDEPTVGLDPKQIHEVRSLIKELRTDHTILLSSHILSEVSATCDRVVIIHEGRVVAEGSMESLVAQLQGGVTVRLALRGDEATCRRVVERVGTGEVTSSRQGEDGLLRMEVRMGGDPSAREALARGLVEAGIGLAEMSVAGSGLEDVFLALTREDS